MTHRTDLVPSIPSEGTPADDVPPVNGLRVGYRVQTPAGIGTVVEWDGSEGEVQLDGRRVKYPIDLAAGDVARLVVLSTGPAK